MSRMDLNDFTAFIAVADHRSFRVAAEQLDVTTSALSHRMRQLEERLGVRLLHRTTRSVSLTDAGRDLLEQCRPGIDQIARAVDTLKQHRDQPTGRLALYVHPLVAQIVLGPIWRTFLTTFPDVRLEIGGVTGPTDIVAKGFDAGIGPREFVALDMKTVRVTPPLRTAIVGSPDYFSRNPPPRMPADLKNHNCIQLRLPTTHKLLQWSLSSDDKVRSLSEVPAVPVSGNLTVEDMDLAVRAAVDGVGLALTLESLADIFVRSGHLVRVMEKWCPSYEGFYLFYSGQRQVPAALRALINLVKVSYRDKTREKRPNVPFLG